MKVECGRLAVLYNTELNHSINLHLCYPALTKKATVQRHVIQQRLRMCVCIVGKLRVHVCVGTGTHNICGITRSGRKSHSTRPLSCKSGYATAGSLWLLSDKLMHRTVASLCCQHFRDTFIFYPHSCFSQTFYWTPSVCPHIFIE